MKETYDKPIAEIIQLNPKDVITISGENNLTEPHTFNF